MKNRKRNHWWTILLIIAVGFAIYANALPNEMFWDDDDFILKNRYIKDWQYFPKFFSENLIAGSQLVSNYWRPLLLTIFSFEWHAWQTWTPGWHLVSIGFHAVNSILLYYIIFLLFSRWDLAIATALLWLVHPVHTEAVVYVNAMSDSLAFFFVLLGLLFYMRSRLLTPSTFLNFNYLWACVMYPLALMSKESGIILPALLVASDFLIIQQNLSVHRRVKRTLLGVGPFAVMALSYLLLRAGPLNFTNSFNFYDDIKTPFTDSFMIRLGIFFKSLTEYFGLIFWPVNLRVERTLEIPQTYYDPSVIVGTGLFLILVVLAIRYWRTTPLITFAVVWFFAALSPTSNLFVLINAFIYEHFLYAPVVGILLAVVWAGCGLAQKYNAVNFSRIILIVVLIALSVLTIKRNSEWRTAIQFYESVLQHAPESYRVINNLGMEYADVGSLLKAEGMYNRAIAIDPQNPVGYHNLANLYRETNRKKQAVELYEKVLGLNPQFIFTHKPLAGLYYEQGDISKARGVMEEFFNRSEEKMAALDILYKLALAQNDHAGASQYLEIALQLDPDNIKIKESMSQLEKFRMK